MRTGVVLALMFALSACAGLQARDPIQAYVVGVQPLQGQGLELRMMLKLRVQNPNDTPVTYNGVSVGMEVQGRNFASGVTDASGTIPRFGETVIEVPVSISALRVLRGAAGVLNSPGDRIAYELKGKLAATAFNTIRFNSKGEFTLPEGVYDNSTRD
jgi:LEA14-like dessication related protein